MLLPRIGKPSLKRLSGPHHALVKADLLLSNDRERAEAQSSKQVLFNAATACLRCKMC